MCDLLIDQTKLKHITVDNRKVVIHVFLLHLFHRKASHCPPVFVICLRIFLFVSNDIVVQNRQLTVRHLALVLEIHLDDLRHSGDLPLIRRKQIRLVQSGNPKLLPDPLLIPLVIAFVVLLAADQIAADDPDIGRLRVDLIRRHQKLVHDRIKGFARLHDLEDLDGNILRDRLVPDRPAQDAHLKLIQLRQ